MSVGDVVADIQSISGSGYLTFQPAAGVEVMITNIGSFLWTGLTPEKTHKITVYIYNGSLSSNLANYSNKWLLAFDKYLFNNTNYLRILNEHVSAQVIHYNGIQIK